MRNSLDVSPAENSVRNRLRLLTEGIERIETQRQRSKRPPTISCGNPALARFLPNGALPSGVIVELLSGAVGSPTWTIALLLARQLGREKTLVLADGLRVFCPMAAMRLGHELRQLIVLQPRNQAELWAALDQSLRCSAVGGVIGCCDALPSVTYRRLQLAAEAGGGVGLLLRPQAAARYPSFAFLRLLLTPVPSVDSARRVQVDVMRCRRRTAAASEILEIDDATGDVRVLPGLAPATPTARAERA